MFPVFLSEHRFASPLPKPPFRKPDEDFRRQKIIADYALYTLKTKDLNSLIQHAISICAKELSNCGCNIHMDLTKVPHQRSIINLRDVASVPEMEQKIITAPVSCESRTFGYLIIMRNGDTPDYLDFLHAMGSILGIATERILEEKALAKELETAILSKEHQEILTQEISHRVKNSFHLLGGLLSMQSQNARERQVKIALDEAVTRIYTIAQVYDELWQHNNSEFLNLQTFLINLSKVAHATAPDYTLNCEIAELTVKADQAITIALLCNEVLTNAIKYAYPQGRGEISIKITKGNSDKTLLIEIRDYGVGIPADFSLTNATSLGMKLIACLSRQLNGQPSWENAHPGTRFTIEFCV